MSELRRYFVGGCPELEDPTYTAVPSAFEVTRFVPTTVPVSVITRRALGEAHVLLTKLFP